VAERDPAAIRVDVVVVNFNYARFLADALDSACAQTHGRVRVIAVDDGSTDASREVIERFGDRVSVVLKENGGQASAINAGLRLCEGDAVIFLDADDVLRPEAAARAAAALAADPEAVRVQLRMEVIDADGVPTGELKPPERLAMASGDLRRAELAYPFDLPWLPTSGNAFRRESLRPLLPVPEDEYRIGADWHLVHLATLLGRVAAVEEVSCCYRVHGGNAYAPAGAELDLDHVRETIVVAHSSSAALLELADRLGLPHPARILSIADLGNRMISLRLEPARHPLPGDRVGGLLADSVRAARRRDNASPALRLAFCAWFAAIALAPRPLARRLAHWFLFPESRASLSRLFGRLQRRGVPDAG
jgi:glycosyltransferase involved in cell wall biosynthesis